MRPGRTMERDAGAATVLVLTACVFVAALAVAVALLGAALRAGARARTAADLAALAAADAGGPRACAEAAAVARRNAATLVSCRPDARGVTVVVRTRALSFAVHASARAVPGAPLASSVAAARPAAERRLARGPPG